MKKRTHFNKNKGVRFLKGAIMKGIIIESKSNLYKVFCQEGRSEMAKNCQKGTSPVAKKEMSQAAPVANLAIFEAMARGRFKMNEVSPVVGDVVEISPLGEEEGKQKAVIERIEERTVYIKRPKMANVTQLVFVVSSKYPKPDLLMLDKQLAFAEFLGVKAVIVLNKVDLDQKQEFNEIKRVYEDIDYEVIETEAKYGKGIAQLMDVLKGNLSAFAGNSGVGKSTLTNAIFKGDITREGEISKKNKRGKNTTTSVRLYPIDENTLIADTPGFSTFDISEIPYRELANYFREFKPEIPKCEFVGCTHIKEENCGIKRAVEAGKIDKSRYERFCKIYNELKEKEERKKW